MTIAACPPNTPPQHGIVVFNFTEWAASYPEFAGIAQGSAQAAFNDATLAMSNSCRSLIRDATKRQNLLYLLTAHCCFLRFGSNDGAGNITPAPGIVGRIGNATEGSVSVGAQYSSAVSQAQAYFIQTKWGALYWQATARYRTMRYIPPPAGCCGSCGGVSGACSCGSGIGPVGTGFPGYNGGCA